MAAALYSEDFLLDNCKKTYTITQCPIKSLAQTERWLLSNGDNELGTILIPPSNSFGEMETVGSCRALK